MAEATSVTLQQLPFPVFQVEKGTPGVPQLPWGQLRGRCRGKHPLLPACSPQHLQCSHSHGKTGNYAQNEASKPFPGIPETIQLPLPEEHLDFKAVIKSGTKNKSGRPGLKQGLTSRLREIFPRSLQSPRGEQPGKHEALMTSLLIN